MVSVAVNFGSVIQELHAQCLSLLDICASHIPETNLHDTRANLKIWGSGLFGPLSLVGLDEIPVTNQSEGMLKLLIGTLGDIACTLGMQNDWINASDRD